MMESSEKSDGILSGFYTSTSKYIHEQVGWEKTHYMFLRFCIYRIEAQ